MPKALSIAERLDRFPPVVCRLLARAKRPVAGRRGCPVRALTDSEIAAGSGLGVPRIAALSRLSSWREVPVGDLLAFTHGCGIDLSSRDHLRHHTAYVRYLREQARHPPAYLRQSPDWEPLFQPLLRLWLRQG